MNKLAAFLVIVLVLFGACMPLFAQDYKSVKISELEFKVPDVDRFELENGLIVYFYEDHTLPVVALDAMLRLGEIYVPFGKAGLAELCGELLRTGGTGSTAPDDFDQMLDFVGASLRSSAETESGSVNLRTLKKDVELGLRLMAEMLKDPLFDSEKFDIAVENKLEEIRRENDNPNLITRREFYKLLFPDHPYGRSGTEATVSAITRDDLVEFHRKFYHPNNCIIALSGDLTRQEAEQLIKKYLGDWKKSDSALPEFPGIKKPVPGTYYVFKDLNQTYFRIGHPGISRTNPDRYAVQVMNFILGGGGFISRMSNTIRVQEGLAYFVGSNFYQMDHSGSFYAACQTKAETTSRAIELMIAEIEKLIAGGVTEKELETAKNSILNSDIFSYSTPQQIVSQQASLEFYGFPPDELTKRIEEIKAVTADDVKAAAAKYLHPNALIVIVVGNEALFDKPLSTFGLVTNVKIE
ncbi:MAG: pitrilysin family protein [Candidatus Zixiibacteriota bacterium]